MNRRIQRLALAVVLSVSLSAFCLRAADPFPGLLQTHAERKAIFEAAKNSSDIELLRRRAFIESQYNGGSEAYERLAAAETANQSKAEALRKGFFLALRDGETDSARRIALSVTAAGGEDLSWWIPERAQKLAETVEIVGGLQALATVARARRDVTTDDFFEHYCRAIARIAAVGSEDSKKAQLDGIRGYFRMLSELAKYQNARKEGLITITLSVSTNDSLRRTRGVLDLLGWDLKKNRRGVELVAGRSQKQVWGQEYAAALGLDQISLVEQLSSGQDFELLIAVDEARLLLGDDAWRRAFYVAQSPPGGFAEAVLDETWMAQAYIGLAGMSPPAVESLIEGIGLERLVKRYSLELQLYSGAFVVAAGGAVVPGDRSAYPVWANLVGADPSEPKRFFAELLRKDNSRMLAFFFGLSQLSLPRQRFLTASAGRINAFYDAFQGTPEVAEGVSRMVRRDDFGEFLREIPIAADGTLLFPGGPEIWLVAKKDVDVRRLQKRMIKVSPEQEDEILLRLIRTEFDTADGKQSQMAKFLAVARIERTHVEPLEPLSALLLAQNVGNYHGVYPYFSSLTALSAEDLQGFLNFASRADRDAVVDRNQILGLFHSLAALFSIAEARNAVSPTVAAELFRSLTASLANAAGPADDVLAALGSIRTLLVAVQHAGASEADLSDMLYGDPSGPYSFRRADAERVKELQSVPSLASLLEMEQVLTGLRSGTNDFEQIERLRNSIAALPTVPTPKGIELPGDLKSSLAAYDPIRLRDALDRLERAASGKKPKAAEIAGAAFRLLGALRPQVQLALSGEIYGLYLRSDDTLIANDPLFLRKHHFYEMDARTSPEAFLPSALQSSSDSAGSWLRGGFADISMAAGSVGLLNVRAYSENAPAFIQSVIASLRATDWMGLTPLHFRLFSLRVLGAKEWIVRSAQDPQLAEDLGEAMFGLIAPARRAKALSLIEERQWTALWALLTLSDLYHLGQSVPLLEDGLTQVEVNGPAIATAYDDLHALGAVHAKMWNQGAPRLDAAAPYEVFERILSTSLVAERVAEWELYVAWEADQRGLGPAEIAPVVEQVARSVMGQAAPSDLHDWRSVIDVYESATEPALEEALGP